MTYKLNDFIGSTYCGLLVAEARKLGIDTSDPDNFPSALTIDDQQYTFHQLLFVEQDLNSSDVIDLTTRQGLVFLERDEDPIDGNISAVSYRSVAGVIVIIINN